jgi:hypothetical protein
VTTCRKFTFVFKLLILVKSSKDLFIKNLKIINSAFKSEKEIIKINKRFYMKYKGKYFSAQRHLIHQYIHIETLYNCPATNVQIYTVVCSLTFQGIIRQ